MSLQQAGKDYDNQIANELQRRTDDSVSVHSMRGSGNTVHPQPDVLIRRPHHDVALELKRTSVATGEDYYIVGEDLFQLAECRNDYTHSWLGVKFSRRELLMLWVPGHVPSSRTPTALCEAAPRALDSHVTEGDRLRLTKPETSQWPSATAGRDDIEVIADELGIDLVDE